ncbi:GL24867 [Drosophila persimilis]|uniref:Matrix-remodeling-associated protein 7 n=2 Tax=pseudoobscura subgroup TaxID=32358 RepID=A0A6I8UCU9_DROPS|nr:matrix-remodeling-associated protein 7 [Drosophila pseudoobscura]XP_002021327.1 matrix-remodeling-associated protein 7 [Drosophila persimilis]EDW40483.1 GL24867 [Drosophila persimilis]
MNEILSSLDGLFLGLPGHYSVALTTLLLCVLVAFYFANFFKDKNELEDEGLGPDEMHDEDDSELRARREDEDDELDLDDDEAFEERTSESDMELIEDHQPGQDYSHLMGKFKTKHIQHNLEKTLTADQIMEERRIEREQLAAIFEMLRKQEAELNLKDRISDQDLDEQVRLYR